MLRHCPECHRSYDLAFLIDLLRFLRRKGSTLRGFPAGCPSFFFWLILLRFSDAVTSLEVFGVSRLTRSEGRQYGVPLFSPSPLPHGFPVRTSTHFSLNHLFRFAPSFVFLTGGIAIPPVFSPNFTTLGYSPTSVCRWKHFITPFYLVVTGIFPSFLYFSSSRCLASGHDFSIF